MAYRFRLISLIMCSFSFKICNNFYCFHLKKYQFPMRAIIVDLGVDVNFVPMQRLQNGPARSL